MKINLVLFKLCSVTISYFSFERFLCLDLWGQFLFVALIIDAVVLSLASKRLEVVDVDASTGVEPEPDCSLGDG